MDISRRHFLRQSAVAAVGFAGLRAFIEESSHAQAAAKLAAPGNGPLVRDPKGVLDLPKGFAYRKFSQTGETMSDGLLVPGLHDGMAAFPGANGKTILVRNHELTGQKHLSAFGDRNQKLSRGVRNKLFDAGRDDFPACGGTTTVVYDTKKQKLEAQFLSVAGTVRNCSGGPMAWGSWITCEETYIGAGQEFARRNHGYNFEVPSSARGLVEPIPLRAMGRFVHEAVALDPRTGIVYQTEDQHEGLIYRFLPHRTGNLQAGGRLQMLAVRGQRKLDTRNWGTQSVRVGRKMPVEWLDCSGIESREDDLRLRGFSSGAARFARGEGMVFAARGAAGAGQIYFACTNGGRTKQGQIWRYAPSRFEGKSDEKSEPGTLELFIEPNDGSVVENGDNMTIAPWGDLIVCEDGSDDQFMVGVTTQGKIYKFARNALSTSEFAGATFSPDGSTLFVNNQRDGFTLAIFGPWRKNG